MEFHNPFCRLLINHEQPHPLRNELIDYRAFPLLGLLNSYLTLFSNQIMFFPCPASATTPDFPEPQDSRDFVSNHLLCQIKHPN